MIPNPENEDHPAETAEDVDASSPCALIFSTTRSLPTLGCDLWLIGQEAYTRSLADALLQSASDTVTTCDDPAMDLLAQRLHQNQRSQTRHRRHVHLLSSLKDTLTVTTALVNHSVDHIVIVLPMYVQDDLASIWRDAWLVDQLSCLDRRDVMRQRVSLVALLCDFDVARITLGDATNGLRSSRGSASKHLTPLVCYEGDAESLQVIARRLWKRCSKGRIC